jgi:hypothetical protein
MSSGPSSSALLAALAELSDRIPPQRIDQVWIFPSRPAGPAESSLAVLSLFCPDDPRRRHILTLHTTLVLERGRPRRTDELVEQGSAPADRVDRLIGGVLQRLKDEREVLRSERIQGDPAAWHALLAAAVLPA